MFSNKELTMHAREDTSPLLTQQHAADFLSCSPRSLEAWRLRGGGPRHVRLGRRCVRYRLSDLADWVASCVRTSTSDPGLPVGPGV
jgi:predicted DNA-binding transcriptional regulator AlpA